MIFDAGQMYILKRKYLREGESPEDMFRRVACCIACVEHEANAEAFAKQLFNLLDTGKVMFAGRVLAGADDVDVMKASGLTLLNCYALIPEDSLVDIFDTLKNAGMILAAGGGVGLNFSDLRPAGFPAGSRQGIASGPISFMEMYNAMALTIRQGGCLVGSTRVPTVNGVKTLDRLGDVNGTEWQDVQHKVITDEGSKLADGFYVNGRSKVCTVRTWHGYEITGTLNHKVRVIASGEYVWKKLSDIGVGDVVPLQADTHRDGPIELQQPEGPFHHNAKPCGFPKHWSFELGELIGLYIGDGCFNQTSLIVSEGIEDLETPERVQEILDVCFPGLVRRIDHQKDNSWYDIMVTSTRLVTFLRNLGVEKPSSRDARLPECIWTAPRLAVFGFIRGLFDADGSVDKDGYIHLGSASAVLIEGVQQLLLSIGISSRRCEREIKDCYTGTSTSYQLVISSWKSRVLFRQYVGSSLSSKAERLLAMTPPAFEYNDQVPFSPLEFRRWYSSHRGKKELRQWVLRAHGYDTAVPWIGRQKLVRLVEKYPEALGFFGARWQDQYYTTVSAIVEGEMETFDLHVSETHTYIANGFISHNSRRGACMGILDAWHPDVLDLIGCKQEEGVLTTFNVSVGLDEEFFECLEADVEWPLRFPKDGGKIVRRLPARELLRKIATAVHRNGEPGVVFWDNVNVANPTPHLGPLNVCNPCGEAMLRDREGCDLGSIILPMFVHSPYTDHAFIDYDELAAVAKVMVRALDNILDVSYYPLDKQGDTFIRDAVLATRKLGLGIMGLHDALIRLGLPYGSDEGVETARLISETIRLAALDASEELAAEKGPFPAYRDDLPYTPRRNAIVTCNAPNGSIAMISRATDEVVYSGGVSSGIEPWFSERFTKRLVEDGEDVEYKVGTMTEARNRGFGNDELFKTALEIAPEWHLKMLAAVSPKRLEHNSSSKTINLPFDATVEQVMDLVIRAHELGCKCVSCYRTGSRKEEILVSIEEKMLISKKEPGVSAALRPRADVLTGHTHRVETPVGTLFLTVNSDAEGLFEVFVNIGKAGADLLADGEAIGRMISLTLRHGVPVMEIVDQLNGISGSKKLGYGQNAVRSLADAIAGVLNKYITENELVELEAPRGRYCPDCQHLLVPEGMCLVCRNCGYSGCD